MNDDEELPRSSAALMGHPRPRRQGRQAAAVRSGAPGMLAPA